MTIFILHKNPDECAKLLDDKSLDKMIKDIAQVLKNAQERVLRKLFEDEDKWTVWALECSANYDYMVQLGLACCKEYEYRYSTNNKERIYAYQDREIIEHKLLNVIEWARDNRPELRVKTMEPRGGYMIEFPITTYTPFPLVMPKKYQRLSLYNPDNFNVSNHIDNIIFAYRNYYKAKIKKKTDDGILGGEPNEELRMKRALHVNGIKWTKRETPKFLMSEDVKSKVVHLGIRTADFPIDEDYGA